LIACSNHPPRLSSTQLNWCSNGAETGTGQPWLVNDNGAYKINDVIIEGISMAVTQRSEFASVVQRNGGQVRGLIVLMREKTASAAH
jgi:hypothetical protein